MKTIAAVLCVKNEEKRIRECLESIKWCDEIIVVDDNSSDKTVDIAKEYTDKIFVREMKIEGAHRNWAYAQVTKDCFLSIDGDERATSQLKDEIKSLLEGDLVFNAYTIPRRNHIGDYWLRYGGQYPSAQLKLFKTGNFKWEEVEVHPRAFIEGGASGHLKKDLIHFTYKDIEDFVRKLNNQTTLEAKKWFKEYLKNPKKANWKMNTFHAIWRSICGFFNAYIKKAGFKDGRNGLIMAYFASVYQMVSYAKYHEIKEQEQK